MFAPKDPAARDVVPAPGRKTHRVPLLGALWSIRCVAGLLALLALVSFSRSLGHLFRFGGRFLLCGPAVAGLEGFDRQLGRTAYSLVGPLMFGAATAMSLAVARRIRLRLDVAKQQDDGRPPVVYLRSFHVDRRLSRRPLAVGRLVSIRTEEEQLVQALREFGPVVALGAPGERLPRLGASRVYVEDADWQPQVLALLGRAALVVIHVAARPTENLVWEIEQSLRLVALHRVLFVGTRDAGAFDWLRRTLGEQAPPAPLTSSWRRSPYGSRVAGIVHFARDRAQFCALTKPPFFKRPFSSPLVPVYRLALRDVTSRLNGSLRPLLPGFGDAFIAALWIAFALAIVAAVADRRAASRSGQQLPVEASCRAPWVP